jgi:hypothetical protein
MPVSRKAGSTPRSETAARVRSERQAPDRCGRCSRE